ncbi:hypothetical protein ACFE04_031591 [Oxalis oulophora]
MKSIITRAPCVTVENRNNLAGGMGRAQNPKPIGLDPEAKKRKFVGTSGLSSSELNEWKLGFSNGITAGSIGRSGGVACLWTHNVSVEVLSFSTIHVDVVVDSIWRCTGFYGNPVTSLRPNSWRMLADLKAKSDLPWVVGGDFNEIVCSSEKMGGRLRPKAQMANFRAVLEECGLYEIIAGGPSFTWKSSRFNGVEMVEKLDRVVVSNSWRLRFPNAAVTNMVSSISDHLPVMLDTELVSGWQKRWRGFKFENFWTDNPRCGGLVEQSWKASVSWNENIYAVQKGLQRWSKEEYGSLASSIKKKEEMLKALLNETDPREVGAAISGGRWRIGDGTEVAICEDKWVAGCVNGRVLINPIARDVPVKVKELLIGPGRKWDANLLRLCFSVEPVHAIEAIPLGEGRVVDQWIWSGNAKGVYCAKEGYYVAREILYGNEEVLTVDTHEIEEAENNNEAAPALISIHPLQYSVAVAVGSELRVFDITGDKTVTLVDESGGISHKDSIRSIRYGANGKLFVSAGDDKLVKIWSTESWHCIRTVCSEKRVSAVAISNDGQYVCFADKFGVVWVVDLHGLDESKGSDDKKAAPLLAHYCSIITSLDFSPNGKFILSADRDFKIRVTLFPKNPLEGAHEIQSFCLGHTEFVSCIAFVGSVDFPDGFLVSGSGSLASNGSNKGDSTVTDLCAIPDTTLIAAAIQSLQGVILLTCDVSARTLSIAKVFSTMGENFIPTSLGCSSAGLLWMIAGASNLSGLDNPTLSRVKVISNIKKISSDSSEYEPIVLADDKVPGGAKLLEKLQGSLSVEENVSLAAAEAVKIAMSNLLIKKHYSDEKRDFRKRTRNDRKSKH